MTLAQAKAALGKRRAILARRLGLAKAPAPAAAAGDAADVVNEEIERVLQFANREQLLDELGRVDDALDRIHGGRWGLCTTCSGTIPAARLRVNPAAERCVPCQQAAEEQDARTAHLERPLRRTRVSDEPGDNERRSAEPEQLDEDVPPSQLEDRC